MFRLDKKIWVYWFAFISIFLISGSVLAASWYSTLSQSFVSTGSASTVHTFTLPSNQKVASDGYIKIELTGDFDAADEYADLYIEGTYISKVTGGAATCSTNLTKKFMLSQANLESWGADGKIVVTVKNSSAVSGCTSTQRKHGLALSVTNLVSSQPVKTLSKVRINCTTPIVEGLTGTCSAFADFSDNSTQTVTSSITNWKADRAASISTSGVITALPVSADTFVTIAGNYTYNGVTMTGIGSTTVKDDSISGLREFRISCPTSFNENTSIQCRSYAKIDGTEREVTTSSTWSENASYTSITPTGGLLTAVEVIGDSGVFVKASYSYGGVTKAAEQVVTVKDVPILPTALTITCPSSIDESSTANCTAKVTLSNGTTSDVTSSSQWVSSSTFATIDASGKITTQSVTADQNITIIASYTASSVTKTATFPLIIKKKTSPSSAVSFTNSSNNQSLTFNGNSAWTLSPDTIYGTGGYKICESSRPTYCLNAEAGFLQSSPVQPGWLSMVFVLQDMGNGYVSMRSAHTEHYIYLNGVNIVTGNINNTLPVAQWKKDSSLNSITDVKSLSFTSKSNSSIKLTVGGNSEWVLVKDTVYLTDAYRICDKTRTTYCLHIEYNDTLQNSQIKNIWYSALWTIKKFPDGSIFIRSAWKPEKYIVINSSGNTSVTDKYFNLSDIEKVKSFLTSISSLLISTATAEETLQFGKSLEEFMQSLGNADKELFNFTKDQLFNATKEHNQVILLLHGLNSDSNTWNEYVLNSYPSNTDHNCLVINNGNFIDKSLPLLKTITFEVQLETSVCYSINFGSDNSPKGDKSSYSELAQEVEKAINTIVGVNGNDTEIVIISHSRGGLVAREYLQGNYQLKENIVGLITTGTPHSGSKLGRIYNRLQTCNKDRNIPGCDKDLKITEDIRNSSGLDLAYSGIGILSDESSDIKNLIEGAQSLPRNIKYAEIAYNGQWLGDLWRLGVIWNPLPSVNNTPDMGLGDFSLEAESIVLGLEMESTPDERKAQAELLQGDGIVDFDSQHLSKLPPHLISGLEIDTQEYYSGVIHTNETSQYSDIKLVLGRMKAKLGWK